ncbi:aspartate/glutamate racemase family protein [Phenylobacterium sp.]|uniref:aspartate/glutamate racemase family protein n=1 Tax=Phenylobacterium sp. TaxID=1871053 RepID=UPI002B5A5BF9|nr:amino acid racemase [Phenylobacterium sp.]HLZ75088.1 amino acid racemase [Phenylobacterium sp.]
MSEEPARKSLVLGVLGGMGPAATLVFLNQVHAFTPAKGDADHIRILMDLNPKVPDRNTLGPAAGATLAEMAGALAGAGAEVLAMPCNTAHAHAGLIQRASGLPLIDLIETGASAARDLGARRVGVLGTKGALRLYREYLAAQAMGLVSLEPERQDEFMVTIYKIKGGDLGPAVRKEMAGYAADLVAAGAEAVVAGCTEAPLVLDAKDVRGPLIDPGELLARRCVAVCLGLEPVPTLPTG